MLRELNVVEQRYRAVVEVLSGTPVTEVAERYGVARQTVHRWMARYRAEGLDGLADRSHAPRQHPWRIPAETEALICELRRAHPRWGPRRLVFEMGRRGYLGLSRSTVYRVLVRHQLIQPVPRRRRRDQYIRWERPAPMQLWQLDVTASLFLASGHECKVITSSACGSRPALPQRVPWNRSLARPVLVSRWWLPLQATASQHVARLSWTGWFRRQGTCGWLDSRSGSVPRWPDA
jgi:transposase